MEKNIGRIKLRGWEEAENEEGWNNKLKERERGI